MKFEISIPILGKINALETLFVVYQSAIEEEEKGCVPSESKTEDKSNRDICSTSVATRRREKLHGNRLQGRRT